MGAADDKLPPATCCVEPKTARHRKRYFLFEFLLPMISNSYKIPAHRYSPGCTAVEPNKELVGLDADDPNNDGVEEGAACPKRLPKHQQLLEI